MNRNTLLAGTAFVFLLLAAFAVLRSPEKGTRTGDAPRPIGKIAAGDVDTIEVTKGGTTTTIIKEGSAYKVTAPLPYAADVDAAKVAFETIEKFEFDSPITDQKTKHDEYEVGAVGLRVVAKKSGKVLADLRVGKVGNGMTMIRPEGKDEVWSAIGSLKYSFDKDTSGWRDKSICSFEEKDAEHIEIVTKSAGKIVLKKPAPKDGGAAESEWAVVESSAKVEPLDKSIASGIIGALYSWKANDFADAAKPEETGLDKPDLTLTVGLKGGAKISALIGKKKGDDDYYVKMADKPQVFLVKKYGIERINKRPIEFRDKTICNLNEGEITDVSVARAADPFALLKDPKQTGDDAWKLSKPAGAKVDPAKVTGILSSFKDWKGTSFAESNDAKTAGLDKPTATVVAKAKGNTCSFKVGAETSDKQSVHVARGGAPDIFLAPKWSVDRILVKLDDLKKK